MDLLIPLIFLILLSLLFVALNKNNSNRLLSLLAVLALILLFCYIQMMNEYKSNNINNLEQFTQYTPASIGHSMGKCDNIPANKLSDIERTDRKYDGLSINKLNKPDYELLPSDKSLFFSPVGDAYSLNPDKKETKYYPSIDGLDDSAKHMFMFAYNRSSPDCCPSTFSTSTGCVCMSNAQRDFINRRGKNKNTNGNPDF